MNREKAIELKRNRIKSKEMEKERHHTEKEEEMGWRVVSAFVQV